MKLPESLFSRTLLAYVPFMAYPYGFFRSGVAALWIALFLWFTVTFFWLTRRFFPDRTLKHAFFLWLIVWAQAAWMLTRLPPFWILSAFFLTPVAFLDRDGRPEHVRVFSRKVPRYFFERTLGGIGFAAFVMMMAFIREACERGLGMKLFEQPTGLFFAAAGIAFLWKNHLFMKKG